MMSLFDDTQTDIMEAFNSTSRYLDDLVNIDNSEFEGMIKQTYLAELQLNKANASESETPLLNLHYQFYADGDVFDGVFMCNLFSHEMFWMRSGTSLGHFLRVLLPTLVSSKIFDKRYGFDFDNVKFPFLNGDVPRTTSYGVYISQLIC